MSEPFKYRIVREADIDADATVFGDAFTGAYRLLRVTRLCKVGGAAHAPHSAINLSIVSSRPDIQFAYADGFSDIFSLEQVRQLRDTLNELLQEME